jgi:hypothetical protein
MTATVEYVADALVNDLGRPEPDRMLLYHGNIPHDCCTDDGFLAVHWENGRANAGGTGSSASDVNDPCVQRPMVTLVVRYVVCWPDPPTRDGLPYVDAVYDASVNSTAGMLADVEDGVVRALVGLGCALNSIAGVDEAAIVEEIRRNTAGRSLRFVDATPILPSGECAGVQWRLHVAPSPTPAS